MNSFRVTRLISNEAVGNGEGDGVIVNVGVEVIVGVKVIVGVDDGADVGETGVGAGAHPLATKIVRTTNARNFDPIDFFMTILLLV